MKLIKINTDHYVVVDDSQIKDGDWMIRDGDQPTLVTPNFWWDFGVPYKKITHSTQPLEHGTEPFADGVQYVKIYHKIKPLSLQEVKELIGELDVEKKIYALCQSECIVDDYGKATDDGMVIGIRAYNQALEDNKEKKYTEEDLRKAIQLAWEADSIDGTVDLNIVLHYGDNNDLRTKWSEDEIIKSLQPKTEWEVEIVDGKVKLK